MIVSEKRWLIRKKTSMIYFLGLACQLFGKLNLVLTTEQDSEQGECTPNLEGN